MITMTWASEETATAKIGDARLNKRLTKVLEVLGNNPNKTIPEACNTWSETLAAYRFFDNKQVTPEKILSPHIDATLKRMANEEIVLHIQDTSEINYSHRMELQSLGPLSRGTEQGFHIHPTLAMTPERVCLGLVNGHYWVREGLGKVAKRAKKPIEEKESFRWLESYRLSNEIAKDLPSTKVINVSDREGDIYEIFTEANKGTASNQAEWLIRASQNRRLEGTNKKLKEKVKTLKKVGTVEFELTGRGKKKARKVKQTVRAGKVSLTPPKRPDKELPPVEINVVYCKETRPPKGEAAIEWILLTSIPVESNEKAIEIIKWYLGRWEIEIFFKILKTGCEVEELQMQEFDRIMNCLSLYMIVAWRILYVTMIGRACPEVRCDFVFSEAEWQAVHAISTKKKAPKIPPPLNKLIKMIAMLGGHLGRKHDGPPGIKAMWVGLQRMRDFALAWKIYGNKTG